MLQFGGLGALFGGAKPLVATGLVRENPSWKHQVLVPTQEDTKTWNSPHAKFSKKLSALEPKMQVNNVFLRNALGWYGDPFCPGQK